MSSGVMRLASSWISTRWLCALAWTFTTPGSCRSAALMRRSQPSQWILRSSTRKPICSCMGPPYRRVRLAAAYDGNVQLRVVPHAGEPIECHPNGCCLWIGSGAVGAARRRLYEASHGPLPSGARLEQLCERRRCVNVDHVRVVRLSAAVKQGARYCSRGHELTEANVVRHRDGRIAYCKTCRNARRRQRYAHDSSFAERERVRQRRIRQSRSSSSGRARRMSVRGTRVG